METTEIIEPEANSQEPATNLQEPLVASQNKKGIAGSTIKIIAIITMLIDHTAATLLTKLLVNAGINNLDVTNQQAITDFMMANGNVYILNTVMRLIGRLGFPLFCFLLIEGFTHTRDVKKYALRLGLFALISEIPFDLAFNCYSYGTFWSNINPSLAFLNPFIEFSYQNVFFTLFIAFIVLIGFKTVEDKIGFADTKNKIISSLLYVVILAVGFCVAEFLRTDYSGFGVLTVAIMYLLRKNKMFEITAGCASLTVMSLTEITAFFTLIPIKMYNGKRGLSLKYIFYIFYPAHLLILSIIASFM